MANAIWGYMVVLSLVYGLSSGAQEFLNGALLQGAQDAVILVLNMTGGFILWNGLFEIISASGLSDIIGKVMKRLLRPLFPHVQKESTLTLMAMNMTMNMLGLGNAATPMGLRAIEALNAEQGGGDTAGDAMVLFLIINASSLQLLPATVLTLRQAAGSSDPGAVIIPTLLATAVSSLTGILACILFKRWRIFK